MKVSDSFSIVERENESFLVNVENGDVYLINDVTLDIVTLCKECEDIDSLCSFIYEKYSGEGDYSKDDLKSFVCEMLQSGIIVE